jgi:hypothetical protein
MITSTVAVSAKTPATIQTLEAFGRVRFQCDGNQGECSTETAISELKRTGRTLADVRLVDFDQVYRADHPRSRQCQAVVDALLAAALPDPIMSAAAAR